ncbi:MAG: DMT family transporter [Desulfurococcus sp.]|nr:DMT family transporter [Desulfurococcus sp.]
MDRELLKGLLLLLLVSLLWGTSFSFIKLSVSDVTPLMYTALRSLIAVLILTPFIAVKAVRGRLDARGLVNGVQAGIAYFTGLYLQAAGTVYTTPSLSAFVTGLNSVHVHLYIVAARGGYSRLDGVALALAVLGLYILTSPGGGITVGVILVFLGSLAWAAQIILVSRFSSTGLTEILYGMFTPGALVYPLAVILDGGASPQVFWYIVYLAVFCSLLATLLQVLGQRQVSPLTAALVYLLEPVFALIFSVLMGLEEVEFYKVAGGSLIILAVYIASIAELKRSK